ncbi:hypothetical protein AMAG_13631 [Allomyces macrogynus ATCC 38327]|uniref:U1 small nuclear ribonucleoprotein C n=1 Tax=Allomyces macrogynus (strain ATCC 38327) TaxID=578462 RepID=A0A0L0T311_ALLM3|nr:hypothetical protein AMAG_13631 [Allomyces macrogynus ATCC 38327]|eukprot:KNE69248.1 hypothetical protein AMAG_13631 [Allomyces macrogynus ATCC 38327]
MPKYYCDYCDIYLTHDSPSVRRSHNMGWKHIMHVKEYYSELCHDQAQSVIDQIAAAHTRPHGMPPMGGHRGQMGPPPHHGPPGGGFRHHGPPHHGPPHHGPSHHGPPGPPHPHHHRPPPGPPGPPPGMPFHPPGMPPLPQGMPFQSPGMPPLPGSHHHGGRDGGPPKRYHDGDDEPGKRHRPY